MHLLSLPSGEIEDARREQRRLEKESTVVAGTVERVIDHIRRGGLSFNQLQTVIVSEPEGEQRADFVKDVQFIVAKWTDRPRMILLTRSTRCGGQRACPDASPPVDHGRPGKRRTR